MVDSDRLWSQVDALLLLHAIGHGSRSQIQEMDISLVLATEFALQ